MHYFIECNTRYRNYGTETDIEISEEMMKEQLEESIKSGLIVDQERNIFIKEGYGALVGICPENCATLNDALKYTANDFDRATVGRPTMKQKIQEIVSGNYLLTDPYFPYQKLIDKGYDLVLGPGCMVYGQKWIKAIYCQNYEEILENNKTNSMSK